jgi:hypothetical protein
MEGRLLSMSGQESAAKNHRPGGKRISSGIKLRTLLPKITFAVPNMLAPFVSLQMGPA